jgi:hypothetical protein
MSIWEQYQWRRARTLFFAAIEGGRAEAIAGGPDRGGWPIPWGELDQDVAAVMVTRRDLWPHNFMRVDGDSCARQRLKTVWLGRWRRCWILSTAESTTEIRLRCRYDTVDGHRNRRLVYAMLRRFNHETKADPDCRQMPTGGTADLVYWARHAPAIPYSLREARALAAAQALPELGSDGGTFARHEIANGAVPGPGTRGGRWMLLAANPASADERRWLARAHSLSAARRLAAIG